MSGSFIDPNQQQQQRPNTNQSMQYQGNRWVTQPNPYAGRGNPAANGAGGPGGQGQGQRNYTAGPWNNWQVGSPNIGMASGLMNWASQVPGGQQYLQSMGMMPNVSFIGPNASGGSSGDNDEGFFNQQRQRNAVSAWRNAGSPASGIQPFLNQLDRFGNGAPQQQGGGFNFGGLGGGGLGGSGLGGMNFNFGGQGGGQGGQTTGLPLERPMTNSINNMLQNPTMMNPLQQQMFINQSQQPVAFQQQQNMRDTQADAVRRGASGSGGDADIRDQLNRVNAQGAMDQGTAALNARMGLSQLGREGTLGALGAGNNLLGNQINNIRSLRDMIAMMSMLQQQMGPTGMGLNFNVGGR